MELKLRDTLEIPLWELKMAFDENVSAKVVVIEVLPPGRAIGADDLQRWGQRRATGRSGAGADRTQVCWCCKRFFEARKRHRYCPKCRKSKKAF